MQNFTVFAPPIEEERRSQLLNKDLRACCGVSRRSFLTLGCAACAGVVGTSDEMLSFVNTARADEKNGNMKVRVIFEVPTPPRLHHQGWPNIGFDYRPEMEKVVNALTTHCEGIDFIFCMANSEQAQKILNDDTAAGNIDGYIVMQLYIEEVLHFALATGKPVLYLAFLWGGMGSYLGRTGAHLRAKTPNFALCSTEDPRDIAAAAQCFTVVKGGKDVNAFVEAVTKVRIERMPKIKPRTIKEDRVDLLSIDELLKELKGKKIIEVGGHWPVDEPLKESLGIELVPIPFEELNEFWEKADKAKAQVILKKWKDNAEQVLEVPDDVLEASARMYLAQKACLEQHGACAITINCLGGFYGGHIHAYPCLGFYELLNEGLVGACECDTRSTITMVVMTALTKGRPGFISDPVMDSAYRHMIYAHCVAPNKVFGPEGPSNPYEIVTHAEDYQGASVRSFLPEDYMTTTVEFDPGSKRILFHQAVSVGNSTDDRACRTKLVTVPIGDYEKLWTEWDQWGWHRVTYYGDLREPVFALAQAIGWTVLEEA